MKNLAQNIALALVALMGVFAVYKGMTNLRNANEVHRENQGEKSYKAWVKLKQRPDITRQEWEDLGRPTK